MLESRYITNKILQAFIQDRITGLSKRQLEPAPDAHYIPTPFTRSAAQSRTEMETAIEEIWGICGPLMQPEALGLGECTK